MYKKVLNVALSVLLLAIVCFSVTYLNSSTMASTSPETGYKVAIDPGHGGNDPGKVGVNGEEEKGINLEIAYKLKKCLENEGIEVVLTRTDDNGLYEESDTNKKASDMKKRCEIITQEAVDIVVSIHQNSYTDREVNGAQVFYYTHSVKGQKLADCIQTQIKNLVDKDNNRPIKANNSYYILIHTPCPTVIVECGFLSNPTEAESLCDEAYQESIAKAITAGVLDFLASND